jgi:hypothetical protein
MLDCNALRAVIAVIAVIKEKVILTDSDIVLMTVS